MQPLCDTAQHRRRDEGVGVVRGRKGDAQHREAVPGLARRVGDHLEFGARPAGLAQYFYPVAQRAEHPGQIVAYAGADQRRDIGRTRVIHGSLRRRW